MTRSTTAASTTSSASASTSELNPTHRPDLSVTRSMRCECETGRPLWPGRFFRWGLASTRWKPQMDTDERGESRSRTHPGAAGRIICADRRPSAVCFSSADPVRGRCMHRRLHALLPPFLDLRLRVLRASAAHTAPLSSAFAGRRAVTACPLRFRRSRRVWTNRATRGMCLRLRRHPSHNRTGMAKKLLTPRRDEDKSEGETGNRACGPIRR